MPLHTRLLLIGLAGLTAPVFAVGTIVTAAVLHVLTRRGDRAWRI